MTSTTRCSAITSRARGLGSAARCNVGKTVDYGKVSEPVQPHPSAAHRRADVSWWTLHINFCFGRNASAAQLMTPNGPDGALWLSPVYIFHNYAIRGYMPGLWCPLQDRPLSHNDTITVASGTSTASRCCAANSCLHPQCARHRDPTDRILRHMDLVLGDHARHLLLKTNTTLSGGNLVATSTGLGGVRSGRADVSGLTYFEGVITTLTGSPQIGVAAPLWGTSTNREPGRIRVRLSSRAASSPSPGRRWRPWRRSCRATHRCRGRCAQPADLVQGQRRQLEQQRRQ
jgi:hypothetical protein